MEQLLSNPVVAQTAMHYGQGLVSMGQQYLDSSVSVPSHLLFKYISHIGYPLQGINDVFVMYADKKALLANRILEILLGSC